MTFLEQFEQELASKLQGNEDGAAIVRWAGEQVLKSYKNGITTGRKGGTIVRTGASRRPTLPPQAV